MAGYRSASQTSPFTDTVDANNPSFAAGQARRFQGQPNINQAISGVPVGGTSPFQGALQAAGTAGAGIGSLFGGGQSTGNTTEGQKVEQGAGSATPGSGSGSNVDRFTSMLTDPKYKGNAQAVVDDFNKLGLDADGTGLSSKYGSSPAVYDGGNTIGLPDRYMTKNSDGTWSTTMRGSGGGGASPQILQNAIMGNVPTVNSQGSGQSIWQQILQNLQGNQQLAPVAKQSFGI